MLYKGRLRSAGILTAALLTLGPPWAMAQGTGAAALKDSAFTAIRANRFQAAGQQLEALIEKASTDIELHYWLGYAHGEAGAADAAIRAYQRAVALDSNQKYLWSLYALENLAEIHGRNDHLDASRSAYQEALRRETRLEWRLKIESQLAELALAQGTFVPDQFTEFNGRGQVVGGIGPNQMHTNRDFEIARHTQDPLKQEVHYRLAVDTDPTMFQSYFNLGLALVAQERYREAIPWFLDSDRVYRDDRESNPSGEYKADAHAFLSRCYLELGRLEEARKHAVISQKRDPDYFWGILFAQRIRIASGDPETAFPVLRSLAKTNPEQAQVQSALHEATRAMNGEKTRLR